MADWSDGWWTAGDGLRLHYRDYSGGEGRPPIICIPGLTRNARDFEGVAARLKGDWRLICVELRGRGQSDYARDPMTYLPPVYWQDMEALIAALELERFVLGVLNSDNIAITAQSFDYGPWRFTPYWDGHFTAAYFDHAGLYSFGRQPEAIHWDVLQLAASLRAIAEAEVLTPSLDAFPGEFQRQLVAAIFARLGIRPADPERDSAFLLAIETALAARTVEIDRFFFDWRGGGRRGPSPADEAYAAEPFVAIREAVGDYEAVEGATDHPYWADEAPCSMPIGKVEAIWSRIDEEDDWAPFHQKIKSVRRMGEAMRAAA